MKELNCLRCSHKMKLASREKIQLGETGLLFRDLSHLIFGTLDVEIYICPECKKLEFYSYTDEDSEPAYEAEIPKRVCPECGDEHDFDYPKCPRCKYDYYKERRL